VTEEDVGALLDVVDARPSDAMVSSDTRCHSLPGSGQGHEVCASATGAATDMQARVLDIIAGIIEINPETIRPDRLLVEYGLDSARAMDLIVALEDVFGIAIPDEVARGLRRVDDIVRFISAQVSSSSLTRP